LSPRELGQRAQIFKPPLPLKDVFDDEIAEFDNREKREKEAVEEIEKKRAKEKAIGRREIITSGMEQPNKETEQPNEETIHELGDLPVCTRTPRMLITGKSVIYQSFTPCTDDSKYLQQQRQGMS
jgi:hypothetical protein